MKEFNLSEKIHTFTLGISMKDGPYESMEQIDIRDVKEFIRLLKEELDKPDLQFKNDCEECQRNLVILNKGETFISSTIDKLAGENLK